VTCSQIWLTPLVDDHYQCGYITKLKKKKPGWDLSQKVIARRSGFLIFLNAQIESESKGGAENEMLKCQFSQMERN
jgi:hypothetical protein